MFHKICCMRSILTSVVVTVWYTGSGFAWWGLKFSFESLENSSQTSGSFSGFILTLQEFLVLLPRELCPVMPFCCCTSYVWDRINFLHSSTYSAKFWTFCRVDNTPLFQVLLSKAHTASRPFLPLTPPHQQGAQGAGRGLSQDSWPWGYSISHDVVPSNKSWEKEEETKELWHLFSQQIIRHVGALLSWKWLNISQLMKVVDEFLILFCLWMQFLLYLFNCLYLNWQIVSFCPSNSLLHSTVGQVRRWLHGACLPNSDDPQQLLTFDGHASKIKIKCLINGTSASILSRYFSQL